MHESCSLLLSLQAGSDRDGFLPASNTVLISKRAIADTFNST